VPLAGCRLTAQEFRRLSEYTVKDPDSDIPDRTKRSSGKRLWVLVDGRRHKHMEQAIPQEAIGIKNAHCRAFEVVSLRQDFHCDGNPRNKAYKALVGTMSTECPGPISVLVAVQTGSSLVVIPGSHHRMHALQRKKGKPAEEGSSQMCPIRVHIPQGFTHDTVE